MSFFTALFYDSFMAKTEKACLTEWRGNLLKQVYGNVLEIGAGTGANIQFYPKNGTRLTLSEPDKNMRNQLVEKIKNDGLDYIEVTHDSIENIDAENSSFDFVVSSLVCCSVPNLELALEEVRRILKPNGSFIFLEHVGAEKSTGRRRWQNGITPVWRKIAGNCHLNRDTESAISHAGFTFKEIKRESMRKALPILRPTIRGIAVKN
ncbi:MAG: class I SAM-dependent methyltransferase [Candidatus Marinimicrobia bacterium]|jgi:ubiquinone/menaquinone biosynthesis C-methylase UbiE|nr:class I SAM-dependent methyltransferase [Candidatus Neomarinimicrobiota bacterium]MBT3675572.1 class I SAM-dependent methyltransferase [Candidatus Neomarinimicrobiota bacterium]MBT3947969.1 class I SAM-dependent methyltransferase [Candidatus Neomarinimicrobiota bacterium]MBT4068713.1 class I SAM-dependent methyltransferase [Candidatus Neomarinimicrobiota bacterium]MBT4271271.1 class I SAM-dependent methyltransferase [Candidatus Neomarinimicrobiota bacterium]